MEVLVSDWPPAKLGDMDYLLLKLPVCGTVLGTCKKILIPIGYVIFLHLRHMMGIHVACVQRWSARPIMIKRWTRRLTSGVHRLASPLGAG